MAGPLAAPAGLFDDGPEIKPPAPPAVTFRSFNDIPGQRTTHARNPVADVLG